MLLPRALSLGLCTESQSQLLMQRCSTQAEILAMASMACLLWALMVNALVAAAGLPLVAA